MSSIEGKTEERKMERNQFNLEDLQIGLTHTIRPLILSISVRVIDPTSLVWLWISRDFCGLGRLIAHE